MLNHFVRKVWPFGWSVAARTRAIRTAGRRWHLTPEAITLFGSAGPAPERWITDGRAAVVKSNPYRTVYRVELPGGAVYVKHCRVRGFRAWAREVLRPPKARLEFENALALQGRGIAAIIPLAWGEPASPWPGESFLITRSRDGAVPLDRFAEHVLPSLPPNDRAAVRRQLAWSLGQFLARLHDAGVTHPDPHPGNLLVELPPCRVPKFFLIDLHAVRIGRPVAWPESRANLVLYNRWFQLRAGRTDRARFWHSYALARQTVSLDPTHAEQVERLTRESNLRFWAARQSRCLGKSRHFQKVSAGALRGFAVRDVPEPFLHELLANPDALFTRPGVRMLKDSRTSTVAELPMPTPDGPRPVVLKRVNVRRWLEPLKNLFRPSPLWRSWVAGHALRDRWLPTPRPLVLLHRHRRGLPAEGYLLTEKVPDAIGLPEAANVLNCLAALARMVRRMHDHGVSHRDLKAPNILLERAAMPVLIDLVGVRLGRPVPFRQRARELARLNASFLASPVVSRGVRLRFLRTYLGAYPAIDWNWKAWWRAVARATAAKVAKNTRSGRPLA